MSATRWNWGQPIAPLSRDAGDISAIVTDRYEYRGAAGRVSKKTTSVALGPTHHAWTSQWSYDLLGNVASITYPQSKRWPLTTDEPPRTVTRGYTLGYLSSITGFVDSMRYDLGGELLTGITYHGAVNSTNVQWTQSFDPATRLPRPFDIGATGLAGPASSVMLGEHLYDGAGNVHQIGILDFDYDRFGRIQSESDDGGTSLRQRAFYDAYGNLTTLVTDGASEDFQPSASTNRIERAGTTYDERGNLTRITLGGGAVEYTWDGLNQLLYQQTSTHTWTYLYDANDDRVLRWTCALDGCGADRDATERWTQRGLGGEVLRVAEGTTSDTLEWSEDFVYGNGRALARVAPDGTDFLLHDHLGSTRLIVDAATRQLETFQSFYPFGEQVDGPGPDDVALKFTGHERDEEGPASRALDYMRARYCSPKLGRFLTVDPARSAELEMPQSWNRLSYVLNNPIKYVDPDGREAVVYDGGIVVAEGLLGDRIVYWGEDAQDFADSYNRKWTVRGWMASLAVAVGMAEFFSDDDERSEREPLEVGDHAQMRRDQAKAGDDTRQVGDPNRINREGKRYIDKETGHTVVVKGNRVIVLNSNGKQISQFKNKRRNTRKRIEEGRWVPKTSEEPE